MRIISDITIALHRAAIIAAEDQEDIAAATGVVHWKVPTTIVAATGFFLFLWFLSSTNSRGRKYARLRFFFPRLKRFFFFAREELQRQLRFRTRGVSSLSHPPNGSSSSHSTASYSSLGSRDEDNSILAAVSTLFLQAASGDESEVACTTANERGHYLRPGTNFLLARLLPRGEEEYERRKPRDRQRDSTSLRDLQQLHDETRAVLEAATTANTSDTQRTTSTSEDANDCVKKFCSILVDVTLPSLTNRSVQHRIQLCLHRDADEPAHRTLRRMVLSVERKYQSQERALNQERRKHQMHDQHRQRKGRNGTRSSNWSVWVRNPNSKADDEVLVLAEDKKDAGLDSDCIVSSHNGYKQYAFDDSTVCAELLETLAKYEDAKLYLDVSLVSGPYYQDMLIYLPIKSCPPTILSVETFDDFTSKAFVGVPLVIDVKVLHCPRAIITWFTDGEVVCPDSSVYIPRAKDIGKTLSVLIVPVRPGHGGDGCEEAYEFENKVEALPNMPLVSPLRDAWTSPRYATLEDAATEPLRVMSYNLLADFYTTRDVDIMYNHCSQEILDRKRRMPMIVFELLAFHADIICLQEVDQSIFSRLLRPCMESQGYQGYYSNKVSSQLEGCAMFWSLRLFERAKESDLETYNLKDLFDVGNPHNYYFSRGESLDSLEDIDRLLGENRELGRVTREKVGQILQLARLKLSRPKPDQPDMIVVGNTHLFYHPLADHIRAMQAYAVARQLDAVRREENASCFDRKNAGDDDDGPRPCPIVLCGDLNSHPLSGAVSLLLQRRIGPEHETWKHLNDYQWNMGDQEFLLEHGYIGNDVPCVPIYEDEEFVDALETLDNLDGDHDRDEGDGAVVPPEIELPPGFPNLFSGYSEIPEYTNYAVDFAETLDYILASQPSSSADKNDCNDVVCVEEKYGFAPLRSAPIMPSYELRAKYLAMPNAFMPSDHISLVCDLEWRSSSTLDPTGRVYSNPEKPLTCN